jgi:hypothetical protein
VASSSVFLHSNWRTGGSALAHAFRYQEDCMVFYDPINPQLENPELAFESTPLTWSSKHPGEISYFEEMKPFVVDGSIAGYKRSFYNDYVVEEHEQRDDFYSYILSVLRHAWSLNKVPVLKMEVCEGRILWLKKNFPESLHIGIRRNKEAQLRSWFEQLYKHEFDYFFRATENLLELFPNYFEAENFTITRSADRDYLTSVYEIFIKKVHQAQTKTMDAVIDISYESNETIEDQLSLLCKFPHLSCDTWKSAILRTGNT